MLPYELRHGVIVKACTCTPGPGCPHVVSGQNYKSVLQAMYDHAMWVLWRDAMKAMELPATADKRAS